MTTLIQILNPILIPLLILMTILIPFWKDQNRQYRRY
jgi:hypothetical protein